MGGARAMRGWRRLQQNSLVVPHCLRLPLQTVQACLPLETLLRLRLPLPLETLLYLRMPLQTLSEPMPLLEPSALGPFPLERQKATASWRR